MPLPNQVTMLRAMLVTLMLDCLLCVYGVRVEDTGYYLNCIANPAGCTGLVLLSDSDAGFELTGTIPTKLGLLTALTNLGLGYNALTGTLPTEMGQLTSLTGLYLSNNDLAGTIPTEMGRLTSLTGLQLRINDLTGTMPTELGRLTSLREMNLCCQGLTGTVPTELGRLTRLGSLGLGFNDLTGTMPTEMTQLTSLTFLSASNNPGLVTTMSTPTTCEQTCGLPLDLASARWTDAETECVRECNNASSSVVTHTGTVGVLVGALAATLFALPLLI